jgi:hypothetical protein
MADKEKPKLPRTFLSPAYLVEVEKGTYGLYRNFTQLNEETGVKEKVGKPIGPIKLFREAKGQDPVHMRTSAKDGRPLNLTEIPLK